MQDVRGGAKKLANEFTVASVLPTFELTKRRALIVFVYSLKQLKTLRRYGIVYYVSRKMKYVVLYMDEADVEDGLEKIQALHFVRHVEKSYRPDIAMNFAERIGTKAAYQVKDDDSFDNDDDLKTQIRVAKNLQ